MAILKRSDAKAGLGSAEALRMARSMDHVVTTKGRRVVRLSIKKDGHDDAAVLKQILGPTGKLRAPTMIAGRTMVVGFQEGMYDKLLLIGLAND